MDSYFYKMPTTTSFKKTGKILTRSYLSKQSCVINRNAHPYMFEIQRLTYSGNRVLSNKGDNEN